MEKSRVHAGLWSRSADVKMSAAAAAAARRLGCSSAAIEDREMESDLTGASCPDAGSSLSYWSGVCVCVMAGTDVPTRCSAHL